MNMLASLRKMLLVYAAVEPEEFQVAEQFGIEDLAILPWRAAQAERREIDRQEALG
jgi:hypothetical protein